MQAGGIVYVYITFLSGWGVAGGRRQWIIHVFNNKWLNITARWLWQMIHFGGDKICPCKQNRSFFFQNWTGTINNVHLMHVTAELHPSRRCCLCVVAFQSQHEISIVAQILKARLVGQLQLSKSNVNVYLCYINLYVYTYKIAVILYIVQATSQLSLTGQSRGLNDRAFVLRLKSRLGPITGLISKVTNTVTTHW